VAATLNVNPPPPPLLLLLYTWTFLNATALYSAFVEQGRQKEREGVGGGGRITSQQRKAK